MKCRLVLKWPRSILFRASEPATRQPRPAYHRGRFGALTRDVEYVERPAKTSQEFSSDRETEGSSGDQSSSTFLSLFAFRHSTPLSAQSLLPLSLLLPVKPPYLPDVYLDNTAVAGVAAQYEFEQRLSWLSVLGETKVTPENPGAARLPIAQRTRKRSAFQIDSDTRGGYIITNP